MMATLEDLEILIENATDELQDIVTEIGDGRDVEEQLGQLFSELCTNFRRRAIAWLLLEADTTAFNSNLFSSAQAFMWFLKQARDNNTIDKYPLTTGRSAPFFDAIACQAMELARAIVQNSTQTFSEGDEYEDDFYYFHFLMQLYFMDENEQQLIEILDRFSSVAVREMSYRVGICKALLEKDQEGFNENLKEHLLTHQATYQRYREQEKEQDEVIDTEGNISIEGLALVRLAEMRGIMTAKEYPLIPSIVRQVSPMLSQQEETWKNP